MAPLPAPSLNDRHPLAEIDEALTWTAAITERDRHWRAWVDALLDQRLRITTRGDHAWTATNSATPSQQR